MRKYLLGSILFGLFLLVTGCKDNAPKQKSVFRVKCDTVRTATSGIAFSFPARVIASDEVHLSFKVSGTLQRLMVEEGQTVRQGELIAQMDPRDYELQLQAVEGEYLRIKADAERAFALYADSVITVADYDKARYGLRQITAKYEHAKNQLADTRLYAPYDGVIKRTLFDPPTVIGAGMPVITLLSSAMPEVEIHIPASLRRQRADILSFSVTFDYLSQSVPLRLISIASHANADQLYAVRLALPSTLSEPPSVGMTAMVDIALSKGNNQIVTIPAGAVFHKDDGDYVWILSQGRVTSRSVCLENLHTDGSADVLSGLQEGEIIITAGVHSLTEGQEVHPLSVDNNKIGKAL